MIDDFDSFDILDNLVSPLLVRVFLSIVSVGSESKTRAAVTNNLKFMKIDKSGLKRLY